MVAVNPDSEIKRKISIENHLGGMKAGLCKN